MIPRLIAALAIVGSGLGLTPTQQVPVFRGSTSVVTVDVSVRTGSNRVSGLTAADFVLLDNGVQQHIDFVDSSAIPVDVTILADFNDDVAFEAHDVNKQTNQIASKLRPFDRLRVWRIGTSVTEVRALAPAGETPVVPHMPDGGLGAVYDGLAAALIEPVNPDARHLVIAITNGVDTDSITSMPTLAEIAKLSNATLHVSQLDVSEDPVPPYPPLIWTSADRLRAHKCSEAHACDPQQRFWMPHYTPPVMPFRFVPLSTMAESTGGKVHPPGLFIERDATGVFNRAFRDFQENYVLRYTPQGVSQTGTHTITVTIPAHRDYTVHARRSYTVEAPAAPTPGTPAMAAPPSAAPVDVLVDAYGRGDYPAAFAVVRQFPNPLALLRALRDAGNLYPSNPHREALLALDLAPATMSAGDTNATRLAGEWLTLEGRLIRSPLGSDAFEHDWMQAEVALFTGMIRPQVARPYLAHALQRYPGDPRLLLADAILEDQLWPIGTDTVMTVAAANQHVASTLAKYDAAAAHESVKAEAEVRAAWLLHRLGRDADALTRLNAVPADTPDVYVRFLRALFLGHVYAATERSAEAIGAYRASLAVVPNAQSARVALMNALVRSGDRPAALDIADAVQTRAGADRDPWSMYWQGDFRFFPGMITRLREQTR